MNIVITGAGKGVGYHTALQMLKRKGNKIFALSRGEEGLSGLMKASGNNSGLKVMRCDISDEESVQETTKRINKEVEGIDVLINNAGILINRSFMQLTDADWRAVYDVNVFGMVRMTRALIPLLLKGTIYRAGNIRAHIVNISSMGGVQGSLKFGGLSAYSSSKGALITISECLSEEFKESGIRVNSIALGSVETEMFRAAFPGQKAFSNPEETGSWIAEFAESGYRFFNGKIIQLSVSTP